MTPSSTTLVLGRILELVYFLQGIQAGVEMLLVRWWAESIPPRLITINAQRLWAAIMAIEYRAGE